MRAVRTVVALSVASSLLLVSCAPTAPDQGVVQPGATLPESSVAAVADADQDFVQPGATPRVSSVAVLADAIIARDDMRSGHYYVVEESRKASSWMLEGAARMMETGWYRVDFTLAPFVGGFLGDDEILDVAPDAGGQAWPQSPPFLVSPAVSNDAGYRDALVAVLKQVASTNVQGMGPLVTYADSAVPAQPDWDLLSERMGTDYLLVAVAGGVSVSGGKQTGEYCLSSCVSMAFSVLINAICSGVSGGTAEVEMDTEGEVQTQSHLMSVVQLFDMRTGYAVRTRTMSYVEIDPLSRGFYEAEWAPSLLRDVVHLPLPRRR